MNRFFMTIVSALAIFCMMAAPGGDNGKGRKVNSSRTDCVTQAELLMGYYSIDGFGLDAEEYDLLMEQEDYALDDMTYGFSVTTCAGGWNVPTLSAPSKADSGDDEGEGDTEGKGKGRFGTIQEHTGVGSISKLTDVCGIEIQGGRPGGLLEPPIDIIRPWSTKPDGGDDEGENGKGKDRFGTIQEHSGVGSISKLTNVCGIEIQGGHPTGLVDPPIDIIRPWSVKPDGDDEGDGDNDGNGKGRFGTLTEHTGVGSISRLTDVSGIEIQGGRPGGLLDPPIDTIRPW